MWFPPNYPGDSTDIMNGLWSAICAFMQFSFFPIVDIIKSQPILLIPVGIFFAGAVIGLAMRLIKG